MERAKCFLIVIVLIIGAGTLKASDKSDIYNAYINSNMSNWKKTIDRMNLELNKPDSLILELVNYQYGYIAWCIWVDRNDEAVEYLELAEKNIAILEKRHFKPSYTNAYKSAFYGFRIGLNVFMAPFIGFKSIECAKLAIELDNTNPYGYIQYGNAQYYMPTAFGGSKKLAIEYFLKAKTIIESSAGGTEENWNYLSLLAMIGKAYQESSNYIEAKQYYEKVLEIEPGFLWVKDELYPNILKKI